jgi:hypothetical protein
MKRILLVLAATAACGGAVEQSFSQQSQALGGWAPDDPRLLEWIDAHKSWDGQGPGDVAFENDAKPTTCWHNSQRLCLREDDASFPHAEDSGCLRHRTPSPGWYLQVVRRAHCLNVPPCGNSVGDIDIVRLCKDPDDPQLSVSVQTVCGTNGPEGCAICPNTTVIRCGQ